MDFIQIKGLMIKKEHIPPLDYMLDHLSAEFSPLKKNAIELLALYPEERVCTAIQGRIEAIRAERKDVIEGIKHGRGLDAAKHAHLLEEYLLLLSTLAEIGTNDAINILIEEALKLPDLPTLYHSHGRRDEPRYLNLHMYLEKFARQRHPLVRDFISDVLALHKIPEFLSEHVKRDLLKQGKSDFDFREYSIQTRAVALYLAPYYHDPESFPIDGLLMEIARGNMDNVPFSVPGMQKAPQQPIPYGVNEFLDELIYHALQGLVQIGHAEVAPLLIDTVQGNPEADSTIDAFKQSWWSTYLTELLADLKDPRAIPIFTAILQGYTEYGRERAALIGYLRTSPDPDLELVINTLARYQNTLHEIDHYLRMIVEKNEEVLLEYIKSARDRESSFLSGLFTLIVRGKLERAVPLLMQMYDGYMEDGNYQRAYKLIRVIGAFPGPTTLSWMIDRIEALLSTNEIPINSAGIPLPFNMILAEFLTALPVVADKDLLLRFLRLLSLKTNMGLLNKARLLWIASKIYRELPDKDKPSAEDLQDLWPSNIFNPFSDAFIDLIEDNPDRSLINGFLVEALFNFRGIEDSIYVIREIIVLDKIPYRSIRLLFSELPTDILYSFLFSDNALIQNIALAVMLKRGWIPKTAQEWLQYYEIKRAVAVLFALGKEAQEYIYQLFRDETEPTTRILLIKQLVKLDYRSSDFLDDLAAILRDYPHRAQYLKLSEGEGESEGNGNVGWADENDIIQNNAQLPVPNVEGRSKSPAETIISEQGAAEALSLLEDPLWSDDFPFETMANRDSEETATGDNISEEGENVKGNDFKRALRSMGGKNFEAQYAGIDPTLRKTAAWALGKLGTYSDIAALKEALRDPERGVQEEARNAIGRIRRRMAKMGKIEK